MLKTHAFQPFVLLLIFVFVAALIGLRPATPTRAQTPLKIMALGDSITGSPGCWRALLWNRLTANGLTGFLPVGTLSPAGCPNDNSWHEGHGGILAIGMANGNQLPPWLAATNPDVVLMHLGTNDSFNHNNTVDMILAAYTTLVGQMRANNPNMKILVAQIIPLYTATTQCTDCYQRVVNLNNAIPGWAAGLNTAQSPIIVVDQWTGFNTVTDTSDGIHPNDAGIQKIADKWYPVVAALLNGNPIPTSTRTNTPPVVIPSPTLTHTSTRTSTPIGTPTRTNTPNSFTPTTGPILTATPTTGGGSTCSPVTSTITAPFTFDGAGTLCWQSTNLGAYINSWNANSVTLNGVNVTNLYVASGSYPVKINGFWYISYNASFAWSHFEAK